MIRGRGYTHRGAVTKEDRWRRRERASALVTQLHHLPCGLATAGKFGSRISSATGQLYWCSYGAAGDPTAERNWSSCEPISRISCARGRGPGYRRAARRKGGRILPRSWPCLPDPRRSRSLGDQVLRGLSSARADGVQHRAAGHVYHRSCAAYLLHVYQQRSVGSSGSRDVGGRASETAPSTTNVTSPSGGRSCS